MNNKTIYWARDFEDVVIPTKREEDAGYDIRARFEGNAMIIYPHTTEMIPTGLRYAIDKDYMLRLAERGSTGSKGIAQRCGILDSGFRNSIFVPLTNTNNRPFAIVKNEIEFRQTSFFRQNQNTIIYPYEKAITQAVILKVEHFEGVEVSVEDLLKMESERGLGQLGSSNK